MRKKICMMLWAVIAVSIAITAMSCKPRTEEKQQPSDTTVAEPDSSTDTPVSSEPDTPPEKGTALPIENIEDWFVPKPVPELDEGNEIYLDADVIGKLTVLDENGEEDLVNAILDGEILLINHFVRQGYSEKALSQIQRFYFSFYDKLKNEDSDVLAEKISQCIGADGADPASFPSDICRIFGWDKNPDMTYVFESEGCE